MRPTASAHNEKGNAMSKIDITNITRRQVLGLGASIVMTLGLVACGSPGNGAASAAKSADADKTITVAASSVPHAEILKNVVAGVLADEGYTLKVTEFEDYVQPNKVVEDGQIDANYFQHVNYLESFNKENNVSSSGAPRYWPPTLVANLIPSAFSVSSA